MTPRRLIEQAKYFGITVPQAIEVGQAAKEFTQEKLSEPFTVFTHMSDAMGQSRLERFYAFVETKEGDLGEQLVRNGLARSYGFKTAPPGLTEFANRSRKSFSNSRTKRNEEKIGAWGVNAGRLNARAQTPSAFSSFVPEGKTRPRSARCGFICRCFANPTTGRVDYCAAVRSRRTDRMQRKRCRSERSTSTLRLKKS